MLVDRCYLFYTQCDMKMQTHIDESGKTIVQISAESGVSRKTIYAIIDGGRCKVETAKKLAVTIGCSVFDIRPDLREELS